MENHKDEISRHLARTRRAFEAIQHAETSSEMRDAWEDYLHSFARTIGRIISSSLSNVESRAWGYRLKNLSSKDDEGLVYLREARNVAEHGLGPFAEFDPGRVSFGGNAVVFEGENKNITISGLTIDGQQIIGPPVTFDSKGGKLVNVRGSAPSQYAETPAAVRLVPVKSQEKKATFPVPRSILGQALSAGDPKNLSKSALEAIERVFVEYCEKLSS